ncbi:septation protein SepH [Hoyosella sp. YIM 151337]|uniref:septation protein SepH n=1 Tax=Hoyosella sp. YIM 151337 TaxID=2992742 RepID=UPI0022362D4E|nr:septation protein SepH [Hoyosella sp. YIM 151337]MCW4356006.1 septation protein SepH [Hoyosella sp. YIM 151337]
MRELKVVGIESDGSAIICADVNTGAKFRIPADDRLRAASHGDLSRLGQIEVEMESRLRPREIQARIRAGASVRQIAEESGLPTARVESFAHPVLLERARMAQMARNSHPLLEDGPALQTLATAVAHTFGARGQKFEEATWDAWRNEQGRWVVQLAWEAGRTENKAHWRFQPGADGGTAAPLDELAKELVTTDTPRPRPALSPVTPIVAAKPAKPAPQPEAPAEPQAAQPASPAAEKPAEKTPKQPAPAPASGKKKPAMPSWEDVLLGVRTGTGPEH